MKVVEIEGALHEKAWRYRTWTKELVKFIQNSRFVRWDCALSVSECAFVNYLRHPSTRQHETPNPASGKVRGT